MKKFSVCATMLLGLAGAACAGVGLRATGPEINRSDLDLVPADRIGRFGEMLS